MNKVTLIGRLTRDPELKYTPSGVAVCRFTLAVDRPFTNANGEREADFISIVTWRQLAETCANYLRQGRLTAVSGRIQTGSYENQEGKRVYTTDVFADEIKFLDKAGEDSSGERRQTGSGRDPFQDDGRPVDISDDNLPF